MRTIRFMPFATAVLVCAALTAGCGSRKEETAKTPMTQAQRDSALAASSLPGAGAVGKALTAADSARARADRLDAAGGADDE